MESRTQFIPVDIQSFRGVTRDINFDVYIKLSEENMAHVFSRTTGMDYKRLASYIQKGVKELYIRAEDQTLYEEFVSRPAEKILNDPNATNEKKIATLLNMTEATMAELFAQIHVNEDTAVTTQKVVNNYVKLMGESPRTLAIILKLASHGDYLYYHSIAVAIFSLLIARSLGQFNQRMMEMIGLGAFLHDIGCIHLSKEILESPDELSPAMWKEMLSHPKLGLQMIENTPNVPDEVRYIVYQHHEEPSGHGYPNGLHGQVIYYPAKIVAVADAFSALISKRPFRPAYTVEQAIHLLQASTGKHEREIVKVLAHIFLKGQNGGMNAA